MDPNYKIEDFKFIKKKDIKEFGFIRKKFELFFKHFSNKKMYINLWSREVLIYKKVYSNL